MKQYLDESTGIIVSGQTDLVDAFINASNNYNTNEKLWIKELRSQGFKAAHPNDGWVDRVNNKIFLCYPQFNDGLNIGDKLMLGWPSDIGACRPVIITGGAGTIFDNFTFKDLNPPKKYKPEGLIKQLIKAIFI